MQRRIGNEKRPSLPESEPAQGGQVEGSTTTCPQSWDFKTPKGGFALACTNVPERDENSMKTGDYLDYHSAPPCADMHRGTVPTDTAIDTRSSHNCGSSGRRNLTAGVSASPPSARGLRWCSGGRCASGYGWWRGIASSSIQRRIASYLWICPADSQRPPYGRQGSFREWNYSLRL
jgi:hypothetical protein